MAGQSRRIHMMTKKNDRPGGGSSPVYHSICPAFFFFFFFLFRNQQYPAFILLSHPLMIPISEGMYDIVGEMSG